MDNRINRLVATDPSVLKVLTDLDYSMSYKLNYINRELSRHGIPTFSDENEFLFAVLKGDRTDEEFMRDLEEAERPIKRAGRS